MIPPNDNILFSSTYIWPLILQMQFSSQRYNKSWQIYENPFGFSTDCISRNRLHIWLLLNVV